MIYRRILVLVLPLTFLVQGCGSKENRPAQTVDKVKVEALLIEEERLENFIETTGSVMANEEVQIRSEVSGRIEKINFREGEPVRKGQLLVEIDNAQYRAQLKQIKVQLEQARKNESRQQQLLKMEGISQESYEQSQLRVAELEAQEAELESILDNTVIQAPFNGTIGLRAVSPGAYVSPGDHIAYLVQSDPVKIDFSIPEIYAGQLEENAAVSFVVSGQTDTLTARIYAIEPRIDPVSRSIPVRAIASNEKGRLIPGAFTEIQVSLKTFPSTILIPTSAVNTDIQGQSVFVVKEGKARRKNITSGIRTEEHLQVIDGLQAGDTLITTGLLGLKEGLPVGVSKVIRRNTQTEDRL